jgi:hypothetical protein
LCREKFPLPSYFGLLHLEQLENFLELGALSRGAAFHIISRDGREHP